AVGTSTGTRLSWDPLLDGAVRAIAVGNDAVYAGGSFFHAAGRARPFLAAIPPVTPPPPQQPEPTIQLLAPVPNPMRTSATLTFLLSRDDAVQLDLFDIRGRHVRTVINGTVYPAGSNSVSISIEGLRPGLYFVHLRASGKTSTQRLALVP